jgi:hypothetical protein
MAQQMDKQEIENESLTGNGNPEEGAYATTHEEVRQGYPVFGRIAGHSEDLEAEVYFNEDGISQVLIYDGHNCVVEGTIDYP